MKYCTICKTKYEDTVSFCPTDGEVLEDDPSSIVGKVLDGQYQIESLLGKGGMGAVYLARHILLGDRVAIKILPPEVRNNADWLRRFRREGQAARRLRHANAVAVHDLRTAGDGTIYMVMEYVEGQTLDAELKKRGRFTPAESFQILEPIMSVLNTAHALGVVHRDLKPENIMIGKAGNDGEPVVKLLDLGIAKMREIAGVESSGTTELTMAGQVLGTPYYMSPEQWGELSRDGSFEIDGRADIYSLGLVAYQMISGMRPYSAVTLSELRREHISVSPPPLSEKVPGVPRAFSDVVGRAISKDRDDRQGTAGELAAQLRAALLEAPATGAAEGTLSDVTYADRTAAHTLIIPKPLDTRSDVGAPTIITDAVHTTPPRTGLPPPPLAGDVALPDPARARADGMLSSVTVEPQPRPGVDLPTPQKSRGMSLILVGAGVLVLILAVVGVGGIFAVNWLSAKPAGPGVPAENGKTLAGDASGPAGTETSGATRESANYWLEVLPTSFASQPTRVAGAVPLASGQAFKFHFKFPEGGYLYIIGPGEGNRPTAFLTLYPAQISGLENNQVTRDDDFSFPSGVEHWLELDKKPGTETYTIIFSAGPLTEPALFSEPVTGKPLSDNQQEELSNFLAKHKTSAPVTELNDKDGAAPFVAVKAPQSTTPKDPGAPLIFEVKIQHK
ncbi:MAG: protein kinase domain-containing protein [Pyrinomonadaceae bacterium]